MDRRALAHCLFVRRRARARWLYSNIVADRGAVARALGKPIILEEFGQRKHYNRPRDVLFHGLLAAANAANYSGALVWQVPGLSVLPSF
jgi:hypothetical protein